MKTTRAIVYSEGDQEQIAWERYRAEHPKIRQRMEMLWLHHLGYPIVEIARIADGAENTVRATLDAYLEGGLAQVRTFEMPQQQRTRLLEPFQDQGVRDLVEKPVRSVLEAQARIRALTQLDLSLEAIRQFLHEVGLRPLKTGSLPAKADPEAQEEFKKKSSNLVWTKPAKG